MATHTATSIATSKTPGCLSIHSCPSTGSHRFGQLCPEWQHLHPLRRFERVHSEDGSWVSMTPSGLSASCVKTRPTWGNVGMRVARLLSVTCVFDCVPETFFSMLWVRTRCPFFRSLSRDPCGTHSSFVFTHNLSLDSEPEITFFWFPVAHLERCFPLL